MCVDLGQTLIPFRKELSRCGQSRHVSLAPVGLFASPATRGERVVEFGRSARTREMIVPIAGETGQLVGESEPPTGGSAHAARQVAHGEEVIVHGDLRAKHGARVKFRAEGRKKPAECAAAHGECVAAHAECLAAHGEFSAARAEFRVKRGDFLAAHGEWRAADCAGRGFQCETCSKTGDRVWVAAGNSVPGPVRLPPFLNAALARMFLVD
jgi:hypothetical protein